MGFAVASVRGHPDLLIAFAVHGVTSEKDCARSRARYAKGAQE
jgi:hypothetical protein